TRRGQPVGHGGPLTVRVDFRYSRSPAAGVWARRGGDLRALADRGVCSTETGFSHVEVSVGPEFEATRVIEARSENCDAISRLCSEGADSGDAYRDEQGVRDQSHMFQLRILPSWQLPGALRRAQSRERPKPLCWGRAAPFFGTRFMGSRQERPMRPV